MEPTTDALKFLLQGLLIILPASATYIYGKRRRVALDKKAELEVTGSNLDNIEQEMSIYQTMMKDLKDSLDSVNTKYGLLEAQFIVVVKEREKCIEEKTKLQDEMIEFYRKINTCKSNTCKLKDE